MLNVIDKHVGGIREISFAGELDFGSVDQIRCPLDSLEDASRVVIDLRQTTFVDSTGLSTLVPRVQQLLDRGTNVTLRLSRGVYEVLALVGLFDRTQANLALEVFN